MAIGDLDLRLEFRIRTGLRVGYYDDWDQGLGLGIGILRLELRIWIWVGERVCQSETN